MEKIISISIICLLLSCKSGNSIEQKMNYEIVQVPIIQQDDTIISNELRFYKITSALNSMQLMYDNYGDWDMKLSGRYQANVPQLVWKNIDIIDDNQAYTISASGTETGNDYFSSFIILDDNGLDMLSDTNQKRQLIVEYFKLQMEKLGNSKNFYSIYRTE